MIEIKTGGEALDLPSSFSIEIEDSSPIFNDRGSQSVPATVPTTGRNIRLLEAPHRIDSGRDPNLPGRVAEVIDGAYIRRGKMNVTEACRNDGITFNIGFDNSTAYAEWAKKKLTELEKLPVYDPDPHEDDQNLKVGRLLSDLYGWYQTGEAKKCPFAVFPIAVSKEEVGSDKTKQTVWEMFNLPKREGGFQAPPTVTRVIDNTVTEVTVPAGYAVTPFLRVWRVLELVFDNLGLTMAYNPFKADVELARLVVLNNAADASCLGVIKYADVMPDCTVEEFLNALWVRFGLVYNIDYSTEMVSLSLLKDILEQHGSVDITEFTAGVEKITYEARQYIRLSAATSIEGAAPSHDRFEDFTKGLDTSDIKLGSNIADSYNEESGEAVTAGSSFLARELVTGTWFRLDASNNKVRATSSSFFNWDPKPDGHTALDLSSVDECVPVGSASCMRATSWAFSDMCPLYLVGARHYHSYIVGNDEEKEGDETPLAFMLAYTVDGKTIGRLNAEGYDGKGLKPDDGSTPTLSLLFQFHDGLFAKFWRRYDEILRHGNRSVEVSAAINKLWLNRYLNPLSVCRLKNIRCLIDTATYSLPAGKNVEVALRLRTIQTQGSYNIDAEQNIPNFSAGSRHLQWHEPVSYFGDALDTATARNKAARDFIDANGYEPHGTTELWYYIDQRSAVVKSMIKLTGWESDTTIPKPSDINQKLTRYYMALLVYDIYEIRDMTIQGEDPDWELDEVSLGEVEVTVQYPVVLIPEWVGD